MDSHKTVNKLYPYDLTFSTGTNVRHVYLLFCYLLLHNNILGGSRISQVKGLRLINIVTTSVHYPIWDDECVSRNYTRRPSFSSDSSRGGNVNKFSVHDCLTYNYLPYSLMLVSVVERYFTQKTTMKTNSPRFILLDSGKFRFGTVWKEISQHVLFVIIPSPQVTNINNLFLLTKVQPPIHWY